MLTEDLTAGSVKTTDVKKRQLAAESITYNFKKEAQFKEHFAAYFEMIGLDPVTKKAVDSRGEGRIQTGGEQVSQIRSAGRL